MRTLDYRVIDMVVEHFATLAEKPVTRKADHATMEAWLREDLPEGGTDPLTLLDQVERDVFDKIMHVEHPRFFAFVPGPSNFMGVMADALVAGFNVFAGTWLEASGPAQIELVTVDWLREACGLPKGAGGLFVSGGSMANITALAVARPREQWYTARIKPTPRLNVGCRCWATGRNNCARCPATSSSGSILQSCVAPSRRTARRAGSRFAS